MIDDRIREAIRRIVASEGMELVHIEWQEGKQSFLRIYIDKPSGVTLDDCQLISEQVGAMLDVEDVIPFSYILEVSSPGLDRPLFSEADFQRFAGRKVKIKTKVDVAGKRLFQGRIDWARDGIVSVTEGKRRLEIAISDIERANLEIDTAELFKRTRSPDPRTEI